jgi:hypothetical protein
VLVLHQASHQKLPVTAKDAGKHPRCRPAFAQLTPPSSSLLPIARPRCTFLFTASSLCLSHVLRKEPDRWLITIHEPKPSRVATPTKDPSCLSRWLVVPLSPVETDVEGLQGMRNAHSRALSRFRSREIAWCQLVPATGREAKPGWPCSLCTCNFPSQESHLTSPSGTPMFPAADNVAQGKFVEIPENPRNCFETAPLHLRCPMSSLLPTPRLLPCKPQ